VAINVEGAAVEREMNKTVLPMMHGFYSLGTLAGAGVGMALTARVPPICISCWRRWWHHAHLPSGPSRTAPVKTADERTSAEKGLPFYRDFQLMLIGVVVLAMAFAEGSANDWLPLLMVDGHGFSPPPAR
jgi:hypothetical protein